ncbi:MAG: SprT family zinc-dependent metalloprotease [Mariprofundaceae bacterium]|nr:SprT family zinc-dependent metalloprotease [Mariprofundaceae bacterium]
MVLAKVDAAHFIIADYGALSKAITTVSDIYYQLRISARAKHARITIKPSHQIEVVLPLGMPKSEADKLVGQQKQWIERTLVRMREQRPIQRRVFPEYIALPAIAERIQVVYVEKQKKAVLWNSEISQLSICNICNDKTCRDEAPVSELLRGWLKVYAKERLPDLLKRVASDMQVDYRAVSVRLQKARWGSCSMQGNISLNAKLLLLPPQVVRYVLVHELSHLKHMNHSAAFWQYVAQFEPDYRKRRTELRQLSMALPTWVYR